MALQKTSYATFGSLQLPKVAILVKDKNKRLDQDNISGVEINGVRIDLVQSVNFSLDASEHLPFVTLSIHADFGILKDDCSAHERAAFYSKG